MRSLKESKNAILRIARDYSIIVAQSIRKDCARQAAHDVRSKVLLKHDI